jgi:hypothetical protein
MSDVKITGECRGLPERLQVTAEMAHLLQIKPQSIPSKFLKINYSLITHH